MRFTKRLKAAVAASAALLCLGLGMGVSSIASASATSAPPSNVYGCIDGSNRTFEHVYTVQANFVNYLNSVGGTCPGGFAVTVNTDTTPTPSPSPSSTSASPSPSSASPTPTATSASPTPTTASPTPTATTPTPTPTDTSGAPVMPTAVPSGFSRAFSEDFNTPAALGSFDSVYGSQFGEYTGCCSTNGFTQYSSAKVLSVANGSMFYKLHSENGTSYAAAPQPGNYNLNFTYGQYGMSVKLDSSNGPGYKIAFLLWPETNQWTNEVDFPEVDPDFTAPIRAQSLNTTTASGSHTFCGINDTGRYLNDGKYHTFLLTWKPGSMTASIDGTVVENYPASCIPTQPMRLSLQAEGWIGQGAVPSGTVDNLEVPYVYINKYTG